MKNTFLLLIIIISILIFSCNSTKSNARKELRNQKRLENLITIANSKCDSITLKFINKYNGLNETVNEIGILPFVISSSDVVDEKDIEKFVSFDIKENIKKALLKSDLDIIDSIPRFSTNEQIKIYNKKIRYTSGALAHNNEKYKSYYPKEFIKTKSAKYFLTYQVSLFFYRNSSSRLFIGLHLYNTENEKLDFYNSIIIDNCMDNEETFNYAIQALLESINS
ncbi:MAG: hypothetical protein HKO92_01280 [Flavobacteriaceae bacterium]|nr:hypothetical protein [Flavobacteriaceae bacterium]